MLLIESRIKYKLCLIVHKILNNLSSMCLMNLVIVYKSLRDNLRLDKIIGLLTQDMTLKKQFLIKCV